MRVAVFWGCRILTEHYAYEMSVREVMPRLGVDLVDLKSSTCCGDPIKSVSDFAVTFLSARILAEAGKTGLTDLLVPCNRCHLTLSEAKYRLDRDAETLEKVEALLGEEGLKYPCELQIWHTIDLLHDVVSLKEIAEKVKIPLDGFKLATHPGCQIIRPSEIGRVDNSESPRKLDALLETLGAETTDYAEKLDCCGAALLATHQEAALSLAGTKIKALSGSDVEGLVVSCPECHLMYDARQEAASTAVGGKLNLPVFYYTQLLGVALGIEYRKLGLDLNQSPVKELLQRKLGK
ncbi:MAG: CoB--CoM heterodisulfide reductase iron-sulfur subunit B family protein [Candidatus Bathyarchaeales archaeon]